MSVSRGAKPRGEVLKGDLEDAIFAAEFGDLISGKAPKVYKDASTFYQNTHPAKALCKVTQAVFGRLANAREPGATIRLSTGFGGGKTHTLMALWHLAQNIADVSMGTELLAAAGRPASVTAVGVDAGKAGVPLFASHGALEVHSLWGEIFYRFGGEKALRALGKADEPEASPSEDQVLTVFPKGPVLVLLDELVIYMARLSDRGQGNLLGFLNSLCSVVSKRPQTVLVLTDPARQAAYAPESASLALSLERAALKLGEIQSRKVSDFDPIGGESARIIVRRLFERIDRAAAETASAEYHRLYERLAEEGKSPVFQASAHPDYAQRIVECYPFHPRLLDTAQDRLGAMQDFQKSRGVLRLFARILREVYECEEDLELISGGEINWLNPSIRTELLPRLQRDRFDAAVSADIQKHAQELDGDNPRRIHTRVASALLLESLPLQSNSGLDKPDLTLAVLRPEEAGPEPGEALDRLLGVCWHTYPMEGERGFQFRYEPNIVKQIEDRMRNVSLEDATSRVLGDAQTYFVGRWRIVAWPKSAGQVSDSPELQLALCDDPGIAESVAKYSDDSNPQAPMPRQFRNAIVAIAPTPAALNEAIARAQRLIAAETIEKESTGEAKKLAREQLQRVKPELQKRFHTQTRRAFDQLFLATGYAGKLEEKYQVPDEEILKQTQGQPCVNRFLEDKNLIYKPGSSPDVDLFLTRVLPGATPAPGNPEVYTAKAVRDRFFAAPGLRLVPDSQVVRLTIQNGVAEGKLLVRVADGRVYDDQGAVEGSEGNRRRTTASLTSFALDESVLIMRAGTSAAQTWTKVEAPKEKAKEGEPGEEVELPLPPPAPSGFEADSWEELLTLSEQKRLLELRLGTRSPGSADTLASLAQPLGAESLALTVSVGGNLKDGGKINFLASDVRLTHPIKPLATARTIFNSLAEGASYEAQLRLRFGTLGRAGKSEALKQIRASAPDNVLVWARFAGSEGVAA